MAEKNSNQVAENLINQIDYYLQISPRGEEYRQVEIIFNSLLNMLGQPSYKCFLTNFLNTSKKLDNAGCLHYKSQIYWQEYLKYIHLRMSTPT